MSRLFPVRVFLLTLAVMLLMTGPAPAQLADWFSPDWQSRRKLTVTIPDNVHPERLAGVATIMTFGALRPDGSDLRVLAARRELPYRILQLGPGDQLTVAFPLTPSQTTYFFYFGNPAAHAPAESFDLKAGLLLEVRTLQGGKPSNLNNVREMFSRARHVQGAGFVDNVFSGFNPFGPPENFIARYSGFLYVPDPGGFTQR